MKEVFQPYENLISFFIETNVVVMRCSAMGNYSIDMIESFKNQQKRLVSPENNDRPDDRRDMIVANLPDSGALNNAQVDKRSVSKNEGQHEIDVEPEYPEVEQILPGHAVANHSPNTRKRLLTEMIRDKTDGV